MKLEESSEIMGASTAAFGTHWFIITTFLQDVLLHPIVDLRALSCWFASKSLVGSAHFVQTSI